MKKNNLWENAPGTVSEIPIITEYIPENKTKDCAIVIFPGGAYCNRASYEGEDYARFFNEHGICAFVCDYRVSPSVYPIELLDARRAVRYVRYHAEKYGIDKNKIGVMGSSAGGHLAALVSTYFEKIESEGIDDIDREDFIPDAQILCYPLIKLSLDERESHIWSCLNLLGVEQLNLAYRLSPQNIVSDKTPKCFVWHTYTDESVSVTNSLDYVKSLEKLKIPCEFHMFPEGKHGMALSIGDTNLARHVSQWKNLLINWLNYIGF